MKADLIKSLLLFAGLVALTEFFIAIGGCAGSHQLTYEQRMHRYDQAMDRSFGQPRERIELRVTHD
jgi:hypothetical protein